MREARLLKKIDTSCGRRGHGDSAHWRRLYDCLREGCQPSAHKIENSGGLPLRRRTWGQRRRAPRDATLGAADE